MIRASRFLPATVLAACALTACGTPDDASRPAYDEEEGPAAVDAPIGDDFAIPDLALVDLTPDNCGEDCDLLPGTEVIEVEPTKDDDTDLDIDEPLDGNEAPSVMMAGGPVVGSHMVTKAYAGLHAHASTSSALLSVAPHGGVASNSLHPNRNPTGTIPPGKTVTVVVAAPSHGFMKVKYAGVTGWVASSKLSFRDPSLSRKAFAMQPSVRNAFFRHQILRSRFNKDGPLHSGNCAPTSLAMALAILGKETSTLSIEQAIHRVRARYDGGLHESTGTTRSEVAEAALELGLHVHGLSTDVSPSAALTRLNTQLAAGRLVVLAGEPGKPNAGPTAYEKAFNRAYAAAIANGTSLPHSHYDFNGHHAILVLGRDGSGKYIVGDPISEVGFVALTAAEMKDFMTRFTGNRGTGNAVWR